MYLDFINLLSSQMKTESTWKFTHQVACSHMYLFLELKVLNWFSVEAVLP